MSLSIDAIPEVALYYLPVEMRVPLKFGSQVLESVTCARVKVTIVDRQGKTAEGWGETPLSVGWVWPSDTVDYESRHQALKTFTELIARELAEFKAEGGHPIEWGNQFINESLQVLQEKFNASRAGDEALPHLAALVCFSLFDIAIHDAYGNLCGLPVYQTYSREFLDKDLAHFIEPATDRVSFKDQYFADFLLMEYAPKQLPVWHLVGGLDPISEEELTGAEPDDGYPVLLEEWIREDGLDCLKIKLRGNDQAWDIDRLLKIGKICRQEQVTWLTTDFNCTATEPGYVNEILDELKTDDPFTYQKILYVEQPFPFDLEANQIDVNSVSSRKPLFMDESAHDWRYVRMGKELGWTGVALKTCKTQTGALLSACWAKAHGMTLMVQDLTNPMLAQIPHFQLAAQVGTIMGVESNGMQFYPEASAPEREVHPGLYRRKGGVLNASTLSEDGGFGYRLTDIDRQLPAQV